MRSITRWLRQKWSLMFPGQVYILNSLGVPSAGIAFAGLPASVTLNSRAPNSEAEWRCRWMLWAAEPGITLDHPDSTYTVVRVAAGTPPGRYVIECVYTRVSDDAEFSKQYVVTVLAQNNDPAGA